MGVCETKNMGLFNKVHVFEPIKVHTFGPNISLIRLFGAMLNYAKPRISKRNLAFISDTTDETGGPTVRKVDGPSERKREKSLGSDT